MQTVPMSWQIFFCTKKENGEWWHGKRPIRVLTNKKRAENILKTLNKNTNINDKYILFEVDHVNNTGQIIN